MKVDTTRTAIKSLLFFALGMLVGPAQAQIVPDATLSENSRVTGGDNQVTISGGTTAGGNLFHSFSEFSVPTGTRAFFNNGATINNIITRVTGGKISNIDGLIRANGSANLFLLNPNGIVFGPNARLDLGGSFLGSTADSLLFEKQLEFSATTPNGKPLLSIDVPIGLQYGRKPGAIQVLGVGHKIAFDTERFEPIRDEIAGFQVPAERTLALIGGEVTLTNANLTAVAGRIELGSVASAGRVEIIPTVDGWTMGYDRIEGFGAIKLTQNTSVDVSGAGGGNLQFRGERISVLDRSTIFANTLGARSGGTVMLQADKAIEFLDANATPIDFFNLDPQTSINGLFAQVESGASGRGGKVTLSTGVLELTNAVVSVETLGTGNGGDLTIQATDLLMQGVQFTSTIEVGVGAILLG